MSSKVARFLLACLMMLALMLAAAEDNGDFWAGLWDEPAPAAEDGGDFWNGLWGDELPGEDAPTPAPKTEKGKLHKI